MICATIRTVWKLPMPAMTSIEVIDLFLPLFRSIVYPSKTIDKHIR